MPAALLALLVVAVLFASGALRAHAVSDGRPAAQRSSSAESHKPGQRGAATSAPHVVAHPQPVPILVYHHVLRKRKGPPLLYVSTREFAAQLAWLARHDYHPVTLLEAYHAWTGTGSLPAHPIVLSFDDGYTDQMRIAAPLLRRYRWPAELDLILMTLDHRPNAPSDRVTPAMVSPLLAEGWELESHTVTHRDLARLPAKVVRHELVYSKERLQKIFKVPVDFLCYPGGEYNWPVMQAARRAAYLGATGTAFAAAAPQHLYDLYALPRIYCYWGESLAVFARRLSATLAAAHRAAR